MRARAIWALHFPLTRSRGSALAVRILGKMRLAASFAIVRRSDFVLHSCTPTATLCRISPVSPYPRPRAHPRLVSSRPPLSWSPSLHGGKGTPCLLGISYY